MWTARLASTAFTVVAMKLGGRRIGVLGGQKEQSSRLGLQKLRVINPCSSPASLAATLVKTVTYYGSAHMVFVATSET